MLRYFETATHFDENFILTLLKIKMRMENSSNFVAFSEYLYFRHK